MAPCPLSTGCIHDCAREVAGEYRSSDRCRAIQSCDFAGHTQPRTGFPLWSTAGGGTRTRTMLPSRDFESRASANSATPAFCYSRPALSPGDFEPACRQAGPARLPTRLRRAGSATPAFCCSGSALSPGDSEPACRQAGPARLPTRLRRAGSATPAFCCFHATEPPRDLFAARGLWCCRPCDQADARTRRGPGGTISSATAADSSLSTGRTPAGVRPGSGWIRTTRPISQPLLLCFSASLHFLSRYSRTTYPYDGGS